MFDKVLIWLLYQIFARLDRAFLHQETLRVSDVLLPNLLVRNKKCIFLLGMVSCLVVFNFYYLFYREWRVLMCVIVSLGWAEIKMLKYIFFFSNNTGLKTKILVCFVCACAWERSWSSLFWSLLVKWLVWKVILSTHTYNLKNDFQYPGKSVFEEMQCPFWYQPPNATQCNRLIGKPDISV